MPKKNEKEKTYDSFLYTLHVTVEKSCNANVCTVFARKLQLVSSASQHERMKLEFDPLEFDPCQTKLSQISTGINICC